MAFQIQLREFIERRPNGDRDMSGGSDCSDFKVVLIKEGGKETILKTFSGFDNFWTSHRSGVREEATAFLKEKAKFFEAKVLPAAKFRPQQPKKTKWAAVKS